MYIHMYVCIYTHTPIYRYAYIQVLVLNLMKKIHLCFVQHPSTKPDHVSSMLLLGGQPNTSQTQHGCFPCDTSGRLEPDGSCQFRCY